MNHSVRIGFHISGRAKSHATMYFRMCAEKLVRYRTLVGELRKLDMLSPEYEGLVDRVEQAAVEPVIYAGMSLEATLFELAACLFGEEFAEKTDKLDPLGKFYVLSHAVNRLTPDGSSVTVQRIQSLITARNKLVHYKSSSWVDEDWNQMMKKAAKEHQKHLDGVSASFSALVLLSLHFDGNIFEELRILPSFKKTEYWATVVPPELHVDVQHCIKLVADERKRFSGSDGGNSQTEN